MRMRHPLPASARRYGGGAIIEFALVLTLMISIVTGILEFGRAFWYYDALSKATRNAARTLGVSSPATIASVGVGAARTEVSDAAALAGVRSFGTGNVVVTCFDSTLNATACTDGTSPAAVRVSVTGYS
ncbi:MAG TPA: TadE/TadG family type IV pilus assembly protein, partial [Telluria sp.]|nr:TadE/TadG family type IV pilus assembly protein [Telluria sp.]